MIDKFKEFVNHPYDAIMEGINIDLKNKIVSLNLSHEKGVDTSIISNPTYYRVKDVDVISIFKRKKYVKGDGNPLLYALKGINGWKIEKFDVQLLMKQFIRIAEKIDPVYDTIIKIPSSNDLNNIFMERLNKIIKSHDKLEVSLSKLEKDMVFMDWFVLLFCVWNIRCPLHIVPMTAPKLMRKPTS